jgi:hypothetical protein
MMSSNVLNLEATAHDLGVALSIGCLRSGRADQFLETQIIPQ